MVKQYRKLDDQIITRLNRAQAQYRDQSRIASSSKVQGSGNEQMCSTLWYEMMCKLPWPLCWTKLNRSAGWAHRQTLLSYCIGTVKASAEDKRPMATGDERLSALPSRTDRDRRDRGWREEEVLVWLTHGFITDVMLI
jgi:hypothetical protein